MTIKNKTDKDSSTTNDSLQPTKSELPAWKRPVLLSLDSSLTELKNIPGADGEGPYHDS